MAHAQGSLNLDFHITNDPWRGCRDDLFFIHFETAYLQCLNLCGIIFDLLLDEIVDVGVVDFDSEDVLGLGQVIDPDFSERC